MMQSDSDDEVLRQLSARLGPIHARQRLGLEREKDELAFGFGMGFFHIENWYSVHGVIKGSLRAVGMLGRGQRNTLLHELRQNRFTVPHLPPAFEGYRLLHLSDLHVDMDPRCLDALIDCLNGLDYDLCVLTGDYRKNTFGSTQKSLEGMRQLRPYLRHQPLAVLGNHDSVRMVPALEDMGYRLLLNESMPIERGEGQAIYVAGVDDAHYFRADNIEKAAEGIPAAAVKLLLCHTPEVFRQAAHAGFDIFLCGHTHGGQICLPGRIPLTLDADCPRFVGRGSWRHYGMQGYTSVGAGTSIVNVRLNCPPEIAIHTLTQGCDQ